MVFIGVLILTVICLCLLAMFDMLVYHFSFLHSFRQLFGQEPHYDAGSWLIVGAAILLSGWNYLRDRPFVQRTLKKLGGRQREDTQWRRN